MITTAAVCPHPPLLLRELTGQQDAAAGLRDACRTVLGRVLRPPVEHVAVVGGAPAALGTRRPDLARGLPLSLRVAVRLLEEADWTGSVELHPVAEDAPVEECLRRGRELAAARRPTALLVAGDGSACRGPRAPGHLDARAHGFDGDLVDALREGDPARLAALDPETARELMVQGRAALQVLAGAAAERAAPPRPDVVYADDPYGVMYVVAEWRW
ncbi:hypothetical protein NI17_004190 [Thermobifida halotolerans]|uniref:Extradiol ring-cleavage dioxygenase class III enzyme subunit B domain-containing protein n=1 Tax=Thermobifida halotolerans TaxID=483545 RepID=A0AA97M4T6_9ACTN|nr:hypothetical protein [Thermobifida halotolerans]UOE20441.1 hypothetical protein NI17_004190 [Thermobifida halotolerans]